MPIKNNHIFKEVGGEFMIIPLEGDNVNYSKVYNLNEVGAFIYTKIKEKDDINYVLDELLKEYEGIDIEDAKNDINEFLAGLKIRGIYE